QAPARPATPSTPGDAYAALQAERAALEERERAVLRAALDAHDGVVARVARTLGVPRTTLVSRLERLGVERRGRGGRA
ncbi:MAG TPA: helix-turn-helix domain-containing protein, partial [Polyangiaceae bacterium LLY-WYZ-15_(1-7)]|nr:helix-turn-helix domain-containing protein [Polyangiaceae bacterium LLY-WYZ-15_(1-7)]